MKKLLLTFILLLTIIGVYGQVHKFKSEKAALVDNSLNSRNYYETTYITFDFDERIVTVKIESSTNPQEFKFKMIRSVFEKGTMMGDCYKIYLTGNLPKLRGIESVSFNPNLPYVWFDSPNGTLTFSVKAI